MRGPNDFLPRLVTMEETWLYHYDQEGRQNAMEGGMVRHLSPPQITLSEIIRWKSIVISDFKKGYQPTTTIVKVEKGDLVRDCHRILVT